MIKPKRVLLGVVIAMTLGSIFSGCSREPKVDPNLSACADANQDLTDFFTNIKSLYALYYPENAHTLLVEMKQEYIDISATLSEIALTATGEVKNELNASSAAASVEASNVMNSKSKDDGNWSAHASEGGTLDQACQAIGAEPFTNGW